MTKRNPERERISVGEIEVGDVVNDYYEVVYVTHRQARRRKARDYNAGRVPAKTTYVVRDVRTGVEGRRNRRSDEVTIRTGKAVR